MNPPEKLASSACLICEGKAFTWGHVRGVYGPVAFVPRSSRGIVNALKSVVSTKGETPVARTCDTCGNLQFFLERDRPTRDNSQ